MENGSKYRIRFLEVSAADANVLAADLAQRLRHTVPQEERLVIERERLRSEGQDFGATVVLIVGTAAATQVAKGIRAWLTAHTGTTIELSDAQGNVIATNVDAANAAEIVKAWAARPLGR